MKKQYNMLTDSPDRTMFFFVLPMTLGNLFQQFYNIIDSIIVGRFVEEEALASVDASYSVTDMFIAIAIDGGIGGVVIVSQFLRAGQMRKMKMAISTTLINFLCLNVVLGTVGYHMNGQILEWMDMPDNVMYDAAVYLKIYFVGLSFLSMYNVQAVVFNSLGDSKAPLWLLILSSFLNIVLDLVLVISFGWGVAGMAAAMLITQGVSTMISFMILMLKMREHHSEDHFQLYDGGVVLGMLRVAMPSALWQSIVHIEVLLVQSIISGFESSTMAGYATATRIESISIVPMLTIGSVMSTFTVQNMGTGRPERVCTNYHYGAIMVGVSAVILCVLLQLSGDTFIIAFLDPESGAEAFRTGVGYANFISFFFVLIDLKAATDGLLRGVGDVLVLTIANLVSLMVRVFVAFQLAPIWDLQAVWFAIPIGWAASYLISLARYLTGRWSRIRMVG